MEMFLFEVMAIVQKKIFRYGYRPIPSEIDTAELELFRKCFEARFNPNLA